MDVHAPPAGRPSEVVTVGGLHGVCESVLARRRATPPGEATLVAVSGIDGSGKGHVTSLLTSRLAAAGVHAVAVNIDGWLALPEIRFRESNPAQNFYEHGLRLAEMFERLVVPLKKRRQVSLVADFAPPESNATRYRLHQYDYEDVDVVVLEGIFLFKAALRAVYDLKIWIECTFETAIERALNRNQEGLSPEEILREYETIYFPAQRLHFELDAPRKAADIIVINDDRLAQNRPGL